MTSVSASAPSVSLSLQIRLHGHQILRGVESQDCDPWRRSKCSPVLNDHHDAQDDVSERFIGCAAKLQNRHMLGGSWYLLSNYI